MRRATWTVAVVGAGTMGHAIAGVVAREGFDVRLQDASADALLAAESQIAMLLNRSVVRGSTTQSQLTDTLARLELVGTIEEAVEGCHLVIEVVPEDEAVKRPAVEDIDRLAPAGAILATNTSAMSITQIASWTQRRDLVIGTHFFNPPDRMPLVEVVRGLTTSSDTVERTEWFCGQIGKETVVVADRPGFATSRLSVVLGNEAWHMLSEGVASPQEIDKAVRLALGFPMGPFELGDLIGLDVRLNVLRHLHATLGERFRPSPLLVDYVAAGYLGRKTGRGVYEYHDNGQPG